MPVYEYRCESCNQKSDVLWRNFSPPDSVACKNCNSEETSRVISRVAFHKSLASKLSELDPRIDRQLDAVDNNPVADPRNYLRNATPLSDADE